MSNHYAEHVREAKRRKRVRGSSPWPPSGPPPEQVSPTVAGALARMLPLPERPPAATHDWDVKKVDRKHRIALTLGKNEFGWDTTTTLYLVLDGPRLILTDRPRPDAIDEVTIDKKQNRLVIPRELSDPLRLTPGKQVFLEADLEARELRLHPAGLLETLAALATNLSAQQQEVAA